MTYHIYYSIFLKKIYKKMSYDVEFSKFLLHILKNIVRSTTKSTYFYKITVSIF